MADTFISKGYISTNGIARSKSCISNFERSLQITNPPKTSYEFKFPLTVIKSFSQSHTKQQALSDISNMPIFCRGSHSKMHTSTAKQKISLSTYISQKLKNLIQFVIYFHTAQNCLPTSLKLLCTDLPLDPLTGWPQLSGTSHPHECAF